MILLALIYFFSRLIFLRPYPVFYDSFEYVDILEKMNLNNFTQVIRTSHQPIHTLYLLTAFLCKQTLSFFPSSTIYILISFFFGLGTVLIWYLFVKELISKPIAIVSAICVMSFPYFFIANTNILYESELLFFQILALYLLFKKNNFLAGFFYGMAQLIFIGNVILLPIYLLVLFIKKNLKFKPLAVFILTFFFSGILIDLLVLGSIQTLTVKYAYHLLDIVSIKQGLVIVIFRIVRNVIVQSMAILSVSGTIFFLLALIIGLIKNKKCVIYCVVCLLPFVFLMQYWHAGLYGRLSLFIIFPVSLMISRIYNKYCSLLIIIPLILLTTLNYGLKQKMTAPIYAYYDLIKKESNTVVITSDYNRFLYEKNNFPVFVLKGDTKLTLINEFIKVNLKNNKIVLIDSAGLKYPYFQYDGNFFHILSINKTGQPMIKNILSEYNYKIYKIDKNNKDIYFIMLYNR